MLISHYPNVQFVPSQEIDAVIHVLEQNYLFNRYFYHQAGLGTRGKKDYQKWLLLFQMTCERFEYHFDVDVVDKSQLNGFQSNTHQETMLLGKWQPASCEICLRLPPSNQEENALSAYFSLGLSKHCNNC